MKPRRRETALHRLFLAALLLTFLAWQRPGAAEGAPPPPPEAALRIVVLPEYAPLEFTDVLGEPAGLLVDMWRLWSEKTGVPIELKPVRWAQSLEDVRDGRADVVAFIFANAERRATYELSQPFIQIPTYLYGRRPHAPPTDLDALAGQTVGVVAGDYAEGFLREEVEGVQFKAWPTYAGLVEAAAEEDVALFATEYVVAEFYLRKAGAQDQFLRAAEPLYVSEGYAAVTKGREDLVRRIDEGFAAIDREDWLRLGERWCRDPELMLRRERDPTRTLLAGGAGLALGLALILVAVGRVRRRSASGGTR